MSLPELELDTTTVLRHKARRSRIHHNIPSHIGSCRYFPCRHPYAIKSLSLSLQTSTSRVTEPKTTASTEIFLLPRKGLGYVNLTSLHLTVVLVTSQILLPRSPSWLVATDTSTYTGTSPASPPTSTSTRTTTAPTPNDLTTCMYVDTDPDVLREAAIQMDNAIDMQKNQHVRTGTTLLVIFLRHRKRLLPLTQN